MNSKIISNNKKIILDNFNKGKFEKVIKLGKKFLKINKDFQVLYALGLTYLTLKNYLEAEKFFRNIILFKPNAENYYIYGNIHKQLKNYNEASNYFKNIINLKARQEEICERYTICLFKTGRKNEVKDFVLTVISKFPRNRVLNNLLGQSLLSLNSHEEGLSYIKNGAGFLEIDENGVRLL